MHLQTISGLSDEVSYGAVDVASKSLDQFLDVCFSSDQQYDEKTLNSCVSLIASNLGNAEQQLRTEANRLLTRLRELIGKSKRELLFDELPKLQNLLISGFFQFTTMSIGSQMGYLVCFCPIIFSKFLGLFHSTS